MDGDCSASPQVDRASPLPDPAMLLRISTALLAPAILAAQAPAPAGSRLTPGTDTLASYLIQGRDTAQTGIVIDELTVRELEGVRVLHRVYRTESAQLGNSIDTLVDQLASLAPMRQHSRSLRAIELIRFSAARAQGTLLQPTGDSIKVDVALPAPVYSSASFDLVLRASPLAEGWSAAVPAFVTSTRTVVSMTARVAGVDVIDGEECWRVAAEYMGMPVTFWVSRATRRLRKQEMRIRADMTILFAKPKTRLDRRGAT
jgi:hypothetical protein